MIYMIVVAIHLAVGVLFSVLATLAAPLDFASLDPPVWPRLKLIALSLAIGEAVYLIGMAFVIPLETAFNKAKHASQPDWEGMGWETLDWLLIGTLVSFVIVPLTYVLRGAVRSLFGKRFAWRNTIATTLSVAAIAFGGLVIFPGQLTAFLSGGPLSIADEAEVHVKLAVILLACGGALVHWLLMDLTAKELGK